MAKSTRAQLTAEQRSTAKRVTNTLLAASMSTVSIDRSVCSEAIIRAYKHLGLGAPTIVFVESPIEAIAYLQKQAPSTTQEKSRPRNDPLTDAEMADLGSLVANMMRNAQPRLVPSLGEEVDLTFNDEMNRAMDEVELNPFARLLFNRVDNNLGDLIQYHHAVSETLDAIIFNDQKWLLYSGGVASLWDAAESFARVQALHETGLIDRLPIELEIGSAALQSCGWVNAFEKVCVVSNRPSELHQTGKPSAEEGLRTKIDWRNGQTCETVFED